VTGGVGGDEAPPVGGEGPVGDVDRDPLFALGLQAVDEQRQVDALPLRAVLLRFSFERAQLIVEDPLRVVQQAAEQRRLAVVDAAAGDETKRRLAALALQVFDDVVGRERRGQK
jgi:hypothetical protein